MRRLSELTPTGSAPLAPKRRTRRICQFAVVAQTVGAILGEQQRAVEIDHAGTLRDQHGRRPRKRRRYQAAEPDGEAALSRCRSKRQGLGQTASLVELDVDGVVS